MQKIHQCIEQIAASAQPLAASGRLADYIPALREVDPSKFGIAVATLDGALYTTGDADEPFSIQSISKLFALVFALRLVGDDLWERVGRLPSSSPFNSLIELEKESGKPRNPYLNAGALVVSDLLSSRNTQMEMAVVDLVRKLSGNPAIAYDPRVAAGEFECAHRNKAAAHLMKSFGNFHNPVDAVVSAYCSQCAIAASCKDLAAAALFLANGGIDRDGRQVLEPRQVHQICALTMSSGTYEASGETAFTIGLPIKSGVGGGVLAVVPGFGTVCAWSPPLDATGTSAAGLKAVELFALSMKKTVFA
ncbi:L-glutaminase [Variovorax sp. YR750]|uniref:glutaminase n=1 Tax=Variovorax sp. YR750 TaxID=1884384 RepID=UPI0008C4DA6A|nr:glutaminase [Variovorax sp. YR750]SEM03955.1 L-glutaminase [Variovorax sp. YR750]